MFKITMPQLAVYEAPPSPPSTFASLGMDVDGLSDHADAEHDEENGIDLEEGAEIVVATPGTVITSSALFMRGHGTYISDDKVISSVTGKVERVNKLVSVRPLRARYTPEVGDLVVGRIAEVVAKRWKVEAGGRQDAILMLSSVNLPGGVQRRKLESDELQMRLFFEEGDLLVAEVQTLMGDGTMSLHTRSLRYGKLKNGTLLNVPPALVPRLKSHFYTLPCGVDLILGLNGFIWVSMHISRGGDDGEGGEGAADGFDSEAVYSSKNDPIPPQTLRAIALVSNIILLLARNNMDIHPASIAEAYDILLEGEGGEAVQGAISDEAGEGVIMALRAGALS